mmetsp:Transcript_32706/g.74747  ORF Transcript_32706/g.74747 Transcript_32706/m.74747 type:complete len:265 (+) Transcript_32706:1019-1813(+)
MLPLLGPLTSRVVRRPHPALVAQDLRVLRLRLLCCSPAPEYLRYRLQLLTVLLLHCSHLLPDGREQPPKPSLRRLWLSSLVHQPVAACASAAICPRCIHHAGLDLVVLPGFAARHSGGLGSRHQLGTQPAPLSHTGRSTASGLSRILLSPLDTPETKSVRTWSRSSCSAVVPARAGWPPCSLESPSICLPATTTHLLPIRLSKPGRSSSSSCFGSPSALLRFFRLRNAHSMLKRMRACMWISTAQPGRSLQVRQRPPWAPILFP